MFLYLFTWLAFTTAASQSRHLDSQLAKPSCDDAYFKERVHELFRMINELMIHGSAAPDGQVWPTVSA